MAEKNKVAVAWEVFGFKGVRRDRTCGEPRKLKEHLCRDRPMPSPVYVTEATLTHCMSDR